MYFVYIYGSKTRQQKYISKVFFIIFLIYFSEYFLYIFHHQKYIENIFLGYILCIFWAYFFIYITFRLGQV